MVRVRVRVSMVMIMVRFRVMVMVMVRGYLVSAGKEYTESYGRIKVA